MDKTFLPHNPEHLDCIMFTNCRQFGKFLKADFFFNFYIKKAYYEDLSLGYNFAQYFLNNG